MLQDPFHPVHIPRRVAEHVPWIRSPQPTNAVELDASARHTACGGLRSVDAPTSSTVGILYGCHRGSPVDIAAPDGRSRTLRQGPSLEAANPHGTVGLSSPCIVNPRSECRGGSYISGEPRDLWAVSAVSGIAV